MKTFNGLLLAATIFFSITSCKKELITTTAVANANDESNVLVDCVKPWTGLYADGFHTDLKANQKTFIKNGVAQLVPIDWFNYHTGIYYTIPCCQAVGADTVRFEARLKNPNNTPGAVSNYDVALQLWGSKNFVEVYFVSTKDQQGYSHIYLGSSQTFNLPELVHYFGDYQDLAIEFKGKKLSIYINNALVKEVPYDAIGKIGKVKKVGCGFKGTGTIDAIKLESSKSHKLIMKEDFDVPGKSNVVWFE